MKKAFFRKHYYSIMADVLNTAKFVFEPLVNPTALEDKEKQQRALEIWGQVEEHHLEAIQSRLRDEWDKAKEPFEGLTKEDIEEAKNDFHLHTYWDIVADIIETAGPTKGEKIDAAELETSQGDSETLNSELDSFNMNNKRETEPPCIVATPQKRRRTRDSVTSIQNQSPVMDILSVHTKSRVNQMCSLEVGVMMVVEDELRLGRKSAFGGCTRHYHVLLVAKSRRRPLGRIAEKSGGHLPTRHGALLSADALENHTGQGTLFDAPEEAEQH